MSRSRCCQRCHYFLRHLVNCSYLYNSIIYDSYIFNCQRFFEYGLTNLSTSIQYVSISSSHHLSQLFSLLLHLFPQFILLALFLFFESELKYSMSDKLTVMQFGVHPTLPLSYPSSICPHSSVLFIVFPSPLPSIRYNHLASNEFIQYSTTLLQAIHLSGLSFGRIINYGSR